MMAPTVTRPRRGGEFMAVLGDVVAYGPTASDARAECERMALDCLTWRAVRVEVTPERLFVMFTRAGQHGYESFDHEGRSRCSTVTGDTYEEALASMMRHAEQQRADAAALRWYVISEVHGLVLATNDAARAEDVALVAAVNSARTVYLHDRTEEVAR